MTSLPTTEQLAGRTITRGEFRTAIINLRSYLAGLLGTDGEIETARSTLGIDDLYADKTISVIAGEAITAYKAISIINNVGYHTVISSYNMVVGYTGLSLYDTALGDDLQILILGSVTNSGWSFSGGDVFVSSSSEIVNSTPSSGAIIFAGKVISPTKIFLEHSASIL